MQTRACMVVRVQKLPVVLHLLVVMYLNWNRQNRARKMEASCWARVRASLVGSGGPRSG